MPVIASPSSRGADAGAAHGAHPAAAVGPSDSAPRVPSESSSRPPTITHSVASSGTRKSVSPPASVSVWLPSTSVERHLHAALVGGLAAGQVGPDAQVELQPARPDRLRIAIDVHDVRRRRHPDRRRVARHAEGVEEQAPVVRVGPLRALVAHEGEGRQRVRGVVAVDDDGRVVVREPEVAVGIDRCQRAHRREHGAGWSQSIEPPSSSWEMPSPSVSPRQLTWLSPALWAASWPGVPADAEVPRDAELRPPAVVTLRDGVVEHTEHQAVVEEAAHGRDRVPSGCSVRCDASSPWDRGRCRG